jgi:fluoroacetyl-CoA thioesterase
VATDSGEGPTVAQGDRGEVRAVVDAGMTAAAVGSGDVDVLATPIVAALAERAAVAAVAGRLPRGRTSVGVALDLHHTAPTPAGAEVVAVAEVESVDGRRIAFSFEVSDPAGTVARGSHVRVLVDRGRFVAASRDRRGQPR